MNSNSLRRCALLVVWTFAALGAAAQVANPGFEEAGGSAAQAASWTVTQAAGGPVYAVRTNDSPRTGAWHFEVRLASTGAGPVAEFTQAAVPVTGGVTYPFTFYAKALSGSQGYNAQWRVLWNAGGDTGFQAFTPGNNSYALVSNSIAAPSAATSATIYFHFAGAAIPTQSATLQLDDVSFSGSTGGGGSGGATNQFALTLARGVGIQWFGTNNVTYQVQWASSQTNPVWTNLGPPMTGQGTTNTVFDPAGPSHRFYQVLSLQ
jgi:hypothetical protein